MRLTAAVTTCRERADTAWSVVSGFRPNSDEVCKIRRWGVCTYARASQVSLSLKPLSPASGAAPKTGLSFSRSLVHRQTWRHTYWFITNVGQSITLFWFIYFPVCLAYRACSVVLHQVALVVGSSDLVGARLRLIIGISTDATPVPLSDFVLPHKPVK